MIISNVTQFANFISSNGFTNLDGTFVQLIQCINTYSAACNCYKVEDKRKMYGACCKLYMDSIHHVVPKLKNAILHNIPEGKITFLSDNGSVIGTVSR